MEAAKSGYTGRCRRCSAPVLALTNASQGLTALHFAIEYRAISICLVGERATTQQQWSKHC